MQTLLTSHAAAPLVLISSPCRICQSRESLFPLCDEQGQQLSSLGYCRECAPAQTPGEEDEARSEFERYHAICKAPMPLHAIEAAPRALCALTVALREAWHYELLSAEADIADLAEAEAELLEAHRDQIAESGPCELSESLFHQAHICRIECDALLNRFGAALENEARYAVSTATPTQPAPAPLVLAPKPDKTSAERPAPKNGTPKSAAPMTDAQLRAIHSIGAAAFGRHSRDADLDAMAQKMAGLSLAELSKSEASALIGELKRLHFPRREVRN